TQTADLGRGDGGPLRRRSGRDPRLAVGPQGAGRGRYHDRARHAGGHEIFRARRRPRCRAQNRRRRSAIGGGQRGSDQGLPGRVMSASIKVEDLCAGYGAVQVLDRISLSVNDGETVTLLGTNGNGKSTLMKCIMGIVPARSGRVRATIDGTEHELAGKAPEEIVDLGIALVPEGRRLFPRLTVEENLLLGAYRRTA